MRTRITLLMVLALALAACASVLGLRQTSQAHPFEHRAHELKGINCVECHAGVSTAGDTGPLHFPSEAECRRCHSKPHDEHACSGCHGETYVRGGVELAREHLRFEHTRHMQLLGRQQQAAAPQGAPRFDPAAPCGERRGQQQAEQNR